MQTTSAAAIFASIEANNAARRAALKEDMKQKEVAKTAIKTEKKLKKLAKKSDKAIKKAAKKAAKKNEGAYAAGPASIVVAPIEAPIDIAAEIAIIESTMEAKPASDNDVIDLGDISDGGSIATITAVEGVLPASTVIDHSLTRDAQSVEAEVQKPAPSGAPAFGGTALGLAFASAMRDHLKSKK